MVAVNGMGEAGEAMNERTDTERQQASHPQGSELLVMVCLCVSKYLLIPISHARNHHPQPPRDIEWDFNDLECPSPHIYTHAQQQHINKNSKLLFNERIVAI